MLDLTKIPFVLSWWKAAAGLAAGLVVAYPVGYLVGASNAHRADRNAAAAAQLKLEQQDKAAHDAAAAAEAADTARVAGSKQDRTDAISSRPDERPTALDLSYRCRQLRQQGTDISRIAACGGSAGAGKAAAQR